MTENFDANLPIGEGPENRESVDLRGSLDDLRDQIQAAGMSKGEGGIKGLFEKGRGFGTLVGVARKLQDLLRSGRQEEAAQVVQDFAQEDLGVQDEQSAHVLAQGVISEALATDPGDINLGGMQEVPPEGPERGLRIPWSVQKIGTVLLVVAMLGGLGYKYGDEIVAGVFRLVSSSGRLTRETTQKLASEAGAKEAVARGRAQDLQLPESAYKAYRMDAESLFGGERPIYPGDYIQYVVGNSEERKVIGEPENWTPRMASILAVLGDVMKEKKVSPDRLTEELGKVRKNGKPYEKAETIILGWLVRSYEEVKPLSAFNEEVEVDREYLGGYLKDRDSDGKVSAKEVLLNWLERKTFLQNVSSLFQALPASTFKTPPPIPIITPIAPILKPKLEIPTIKVTPKPQPIVKPSLPKTQIKPFVLPQQPGRPKKPTIFAKISPGLPIPVVPTRANILTGMVLTKDGEIIEGAILEIRNSHGLPVRALKTNRLGQFVIATPLENGPYEIETEKEGFSFAIIKIEAKGEIISPIEIRAN